MAAGLSRGISLRDDQKTFVFDPFLSADLFLITDFMTIKSVLARPSASTIRIYQAISSPSPNNRGEELTPILQRFCLG
jgi:hypothetical protein